MSNLADELKQMIIDVLALEDIRIEDIDTDAPLFGDGTKLGGTSLATSQTSSSPLAPAL